MEVNILPLMKLIFPRDFSVHSTFNVADLSPFDAGEHSTLNEIDLPGRLFSTFYLQCYDLS